MNNYSSKEPDKKSYYELEVVKQKVLNCICIEENILATLGFYETLEKNINIKNVDAIFRVNTYQYNGLISNIILKLKSIHESHQNDRKGNIIRVIKEMISEGQNVSKIEIEYKEYLSNDQIMSKIKSFRNNTVAHDLNEKTRDLSYPEVSEAIKQTITIIRNLDTFFNIDEDDYEFIRTQAKKDIEYYFSALMNGLIKGLSL